MFKMLLSAVAFLALSTAFAFPMPKAGMSLMSLPANFTANFNFEGIVALSNCSGSLIRLENSKDTDKGLILTNGHCLEFGMPDPGEVVYGKPSNRSFRLYDSNNKVVGRLNATEVVYSTMTKTDMTIYKLRETYAEIKSQFNVNALLLASQHPNVADPIEVISGYWDRGYSCAVEAFVTELREQGWSMNDSIRYSRPGCEVIGGTSGSPIINSSNRTVIGVNNTGNEDGRQCTMNNPCEVDKDGVISATKGYSYGQQTFWVYSCLNQYNELDVTVPGCLLPH
ncbi:MAG: trypsin-like peptidase domain-containing protein [Bdellovibrionales bacterium]|nr:trypsin-like peptidase domain-containing protein [Oligoflexia bacterium]